MIHTHDLQNPGKGTDKTHDIFTRANKEEHDKDHEHGAIRLPGVGEDYFLAVLDCLRSKCGEQSRGHRARPRLR